MHGINTNSGVELGKQSQVCYINGYKLLSELGEGSYGKVYLVEKKNQQYAMKMLDKMRIWERNIFKFVADEIKIMKQLNCANCVGLIEFFIIETHICLVEEYCNGGNLLRFIKSKPIPESELMQIVVQILKGYKAIHQKQFIHRDLKLDNIMIHVEENNSITYKIADFGLAKSSLYDNQYCGSNLYMAPEIIQQLDYNYKADLWSLGVIIFVLLFKQFPFTQTKNVCTRIKEMKRKTTPFFDVDQIVHQQGTITWQNGTPCSQEIKQLLKRIFVFNAMDRISFSQLYSLPLFQKFLDADTRQQSSIMYRAIESQTSYASSESRVACSPTRRQDQYAQNLTSISEFQDQDWSDLINENSNNFFPEASNQAFKTKRSQSNPNYKFLAEKSVHSSQNITQKDTEADMAIQSEGKIHNVNCWTQNGLEKEEYAGGFPSLQQEDPTCKGPKLNLPKLCVNDTTSTKVTKVDSFRYDVLSTLRDKLIEDITEYEKTNLIQPKFAEQVQQYRLEIQKYQFISDTITTLEEIDQILASRVLCEYLLIKLKLFYAVQLYDSLDKRQNILNLKDFASFLEHHSSLIIKNKIRQDIQYTSERYIKLYYQINKQSIPETDEIYHLISKEVHTQDFEGLKVPLRKFFDKIIRKCMRKSQKFIADEPSQAKSYLRSALLLLICMVSNNIFMEERIRKAFSIYFGYAKNPKTFEFWEFFIWTQIASLTDLEHQIFIIIQVAFGKTQMKSFQKFIYEN